MTLPILQISTHHTAACYTKSWRQFLGKECLIFSTKTSSLITSFRKDFGRRSMELANIRSPCPTSSVIRSVIREVTLLDLKNAFGEVHHDLIRAALQYHHLPNNIYQGSATAVTSNKEWTNFLEVKKGVLQEDPSSPLLFNLC